VVVVVPRESEKKGGGGKKMWRTWVAGWREVEFLVAANSEAEAKEAMPD